MPLQPDKVTKVQLKYQRDFLWQLDRTRLLYSKGLQIFLKSVNKITLKYKQLALFKIPMNKQSVIIMITISTNKSNFLHKIFWSDNYWSRTKTLIIYFAKIVNYIGAARNPFKFVFIISILSTLIGSILLIPGSISILRRYPVSVRRGENIWIPILMQIVVCCTIKISVSRASRGRPN